MPWILWGAAGAPERTALPAGSTPIRRSFGRRGFSTWPMPVTVPPVPTPQTMASTSPPVSRQISSAVVSRWIAGFAGLANCCSITAPSISATSSSARASAPGMPFSAGVSSSSDPSRRRMRRRSTDMLSGMVRIRR